MANINKIIKSKNLPKQTNVAWVDLNGETPIEKHFINGRWVEIGGNGGSNVVANPDEEATEALNKIKVNDVVYNADISGKADKANTPQMFNTTGINALTDEQCKEIKIGDVVVVSNNGVDYTCIVATKTSNTIHLYYVYGDNKTLFKLKYQKTNGTWSFNKQDIINLEIPQETVMPQSGGMKSNTLYVLGELNSDTTFVLSPVGDNTITNVWTWTFETGDTVPTLAFPNVIWTDASKTEEVDGVTMPVIEANKHYEVTIMNGYGTIMSATIPEVEESEGE